MNYTAWWFEIDPVTGRSDRFARDFELLTEAIDFAVDNYHKTRVGEISLCPWHPANQVKVKVLA